jgi:hypothetical protein
VDRRRITTTTGTSPSHFPIVLPSAIFAAGTVAPDVRAGSSPGTK